MGNIQRTSLQFFSYVLLMEIGRGREAGTYLAISFSKTSLGVIRI